MQTSSACQMPVVSYRRLLLLGAGLLAQPYGAGALAPQPRPAGIPAQPDSAVLAGRVTDPRGQPLAGARVVVSPQRNPRESRFGSTSQDGRYRIVVPAGDPLQVAVRAIGHEPLHVQVVAHGGHTLLNLVLERAPQHMPAVNVTGATASEIATTAGATAVIGPAVLHARVPVTVADALRTVPGITTAEEDPFGLNLNVAFRGLPPRRSARTLLLEDGVPILLGPYGDPSMHYAPPRESLEQIEIVKGSAQVMNGPQTVGGVINFVTMSPPMDGTRAELVAGAGGGNLRNAQLRLGAGRRGLGVSLDYSRRSGDGVRREQSHSFDNVIVKGTLPLGAGGSLLLKGGMWRENSRISETGLTQEEFLHDPHSLPFTAGGRFDVSRQVAQAVHEVRLGAARLGTNLYYTRTSRASWRQSGESGERIHNDDYAEDFGCAAGATSYAECGNQGRPRDYTVLGIEPRLSLQLGEPAAGIALDAGVRLYSENVRRRQFLGRTPVSREDDAVATRDNEIHTRAAAAFAQARVQHGAFALAPALRIEQVSQDIHNRFTGSEASGRQSYTQLLPGIGATINPMPGATFFAGVHRGFSPPRPADVYSPRPGQPLALVEPETSWNWEAGARLAPGNGISLEVTHFRMDFSNQVVEAAAGSGQRFVNGGRTLHQGLETAVGVSLGSLRNRANDLTLAASWTFIPVARFASDVQAAEGTAGNRLPYAPRNLLAGSATLSHQSGFTIGTAVEYTSPQFGDGDNTTAPSDDGQAGLLPAYTVAHAFASYAIPRTRAQLRGSVRNVFDALYITQRVEGIQTGMRRLGRVELHWAF